MKQIGDFLERFKKFASESDEAKKVIIEVLNKNNIVITDPKKITSKNGILRVQISPIGKSELFLKQKKILMDLQENSLTKKITKIL